MGLEQLHLEGKDKIQFSIEIIQAHEPPEGYFLADSGGKDSRALYKLAELANVKFDAHYHPSPLDPPEVIKFLREYFPDVIFDKPPMSFWKAFDKKGFPLRRRRWCCEYIKESGGVGRTILLGWRSQESTSRKKRCFVSYNEPGRTRFDKGKTRNIIAPLLLWTHSDVWEFLKRYGVPYCSVYDEGASGRYKGDGDFPRLGCVLCPCAPDKQRLREYYRWPKIALAWQHGFERLYYSRSRPQECWPSPEAMFWWWMAPTKLNKGDSAPRLSDRGD